MLIDGVGELGAGDLAVVGEEEFECEQAIFVAGKSFANEGVSSGDLTFEFGVATEFFLSSGLAPQRPREREAAERD